MASSIVICESYRYDRGCLISYYPPIGAGDPRTAQGHACGREGNLTMLTELRGGWFALTLALLSQPVWAVSGVMLRDDVLRAAGNAGGAKIALARKGKTVDVLGSRGGWTQVRLGAASGWVRLLSVRRGPASRTDFQGSIGSAENAVRSPHDSGAITATSGVRGLDMADLSAARFDAGQIALLETYASRKADAAAFAAQAGLSGRALAYLPAPATQGALGGLDGFGGE
jgi:hypothetical protein